MRLLFTGASGFLGQNIEAILRERYDSVTTVGLGETDDLTVNLALTEPNLTEHFDIVLHSAGKAHVVPRTKEEADAFFAVNYGGTVNLCKALERVGVPKSMVYVSTVAVYGCESGELITEEHALNGSTPYARSKIMAEEYLTDWCGKHGVILTILRPSLLAGKNPTGNLLDMVRGIGKGFYVNIAGGKVRKSIMMAEDIARLLPLVAGIGGIYNVCDTRQPTYGELSRVIAGQLGKRQPLSIPFFVAKGLALAGDIIGGRFPINSARLDKLTKPLTFSNAKAVKTLNWQPMNVLENFKIE